MKVKDLIKHLSKHDPDLEVEIQVEPLGDRYFFHEGSEIKETFYNTKDNRYLLIDLSGDNVD